MNQLSEQDYEEALRLELAEGDAVLGALRPILRHLLAHDGRSPFSDETLAQVRGMIYSLARELLQARAAAAGAPEPGAVGEQEAERLAESLLGHAGLLNHLHALALEWQLARRLKDDSGTDFVLSPLHQALIASSEADTAARAMAALAAQARFAQSLRRMELPLFELPADIFHACLLALSDSSLEDSDRTAAAKAEELLRARFDESSSRAGLLARLVTGMGSGALAALKIEHAGAALFLSALAIASGQERDLAALATDERQIARLALALRAAGLSAQSVTEQISVLHPQLSAPRGLERLGADRAAELLSASAPAMVG